MISLFVVDASTNSVLRELLPGDVINPAEFPTDNFSILAEVDDGVGQKSVVFFVDGVEAKTENIEPYALFGDDSGDFDGGAIFSEGPHTITATAFSGGNGTGAPLATIELAFEVSSVVGPTIAITTPIAGDDIVNAAEVAAPLEISGTTMNVQDGQIVVCFLDGQQFSSTVTGGDWTVTVPPEILQELDQGAYEITADVSDIEGVPAAQARATFTIDTIAPVAANITGFDTDTGAPGDGITADSTPTLQGTSEPGSTVEVFAGGESQGTTTADSAGNWSFTTSRLEAGDYSFTAVASDAGGNTGPASAPFDLTIEEGLSQIRLFLVDADTDQVLRELLPGDLINPAEFPDDNFAILAEVDATVGESSLAFYVDGVLVKTENLVPYAIFGDSSGNFTGGAVFPDGPHTITATAFSGSGGSGTPLATVSRDVTVGEVLDPVVAISAPIAGDDVINAAEAGADLIVSGTTANVEDGQIVTLVLGGVGYAAPVAGNAWTVTVPAADVAALVQGEVALTADVANAAGVPATQAVASVDVDTLAPDAPVITGYVSDTGVIGDGVTADTTPTLSGTAEAQSTITVFDGADLLGTTVADGNGDWSFTAPPLPGGAHAFTATATDGAGNAGPPSAALDLLIGGPTIAIATPIATDDIINASEAGSGLTVTGSTTGVEDGQTVALDLGGLTFTAPVASGAWSLAIASGDLAGLPDGPLALTADVSDAAGVPAAQAVAGLTLDTTPPAEPVITGFTDDTGAIGDGATADTTPTLSGTAEAASTVEVFDGGTSLGTTLADASGAWSFTTDALALGAHAFTATASDPAGNTSNASPVFDLTIEEAPSDIRLFLVDADTDQVLRELLPGDTIDPADFPNSNFAVLAEVAPSIGESSLVFFVDGVAVKTENRVPYAIFGDDDGDFDGEDVFADGPHTIGATAFSAEKGRGEILSTVSLEITVGEPPSIPTLAITTPIAGGGAGLDYDFLNAAEAGQDLVIAGTSENVEDGQFVTVMIAGQSYAAPVAGGTWTVTIPSADLQVLPQGAQSITADVTNAGGIPAAQASETIFVDTIAPDVPVITGFSDDTGIAGDGITSDATPIFSGTAEVDSLVTIYSGSDVLGVGVTNGAWAISTGPLAPGTYTLTATATDDAGNVSALSAPFDLTISPQPTITITTPIAEDGILNAGEVESELIISGVTSDVEDGQQVSVILAGETYTADVFDNAWSATVPIVDLLALPEGGQTVTADVSNLAGLPAVQASTALDVDTLAPAAPVITGFSDDTGTPGDAVTADTTLTLTGTAEPGSTVELLDGSETIATTDADVNGDWTITTAPLTLGLHTFSALAVDVAGNVGPSSADFPVTIAAEPTISITTPIADDDIVNAAEAGSDLTISGATTNVEDGQMVTVTLAALTYMATVSADGWTVTVPAADLAGLADGPQTVTADVTNLGGTPAVQASAALEVDTLAPDAPVITGFTEDTGIVGDGATSDTTPTLAGTAEADSTIEIFDGAASLGTAVADVNGDWTFTTVPLAQGDHTFTAVARDAAGNASVASAVLSLAVTGDFVANEAATGIDRAHAVQVVDLDQDGDSDIVTAATNENRLIWLENDGAQNFTEHALPADLIGTFELAVSDLDQDGDLDLLGVAFTGDDLIWYENDGAENFTSHAIALDTLDAVHSVEVADINADGFLDIVVAAQNESAVYWFANDGDENFTQNTVDTGLTNVRISDVGDIDGDGDIDVVSAVQGAHEVVWHENDGSGNFTTYVVGSVGTVNSVIAVDIDGDGDTDIASVSSGENLVQWFENNDDGTGAALTFTEHTVFDHPNVQLFSIAADDVDGDGDIDLMSAARVTGEVFWYEQEDDGTWTEHVVFDGTGQMIDVGSGDVDGDGRTDIVAADQLADIVYWFENDIIA